MVSVTADQATVSVSWQLPTLGFCPLTEEPGDYVSKDGFQVLGKDTPEL